MLPSLGEYIENKNGRTKLINEGGSLIELFDRSKQLDLFESDHTEKVLYFKWNSFTYKFHCIGFIMHILYMILLVVYIQFRYI